MITGNVIGGILKDPGTIILVDKDGNEYPAVFTGEEVELTATTNDVREGKTVALTSGLATGTKVIPAYHTREGQRIITNGSPYTITALKHMDIYDYTKLQAIICDYNTTTSDSVSTDKVSIEDKLYAVKSTDVIGMSIKEHSDKNINLGSTNNTGKIQIIRYFVYKEIE